MNRIDHLVQNKQGGILSIYFTAGHPDLNDTARIIKLLSDSGVDMIEIGMPFSDPVADGPVIQKSSEKALKNGMSLVKLFEQLKAIRTVTSIPLLLMGYLNPVMQFGMESFCKKCSETGIDGLIIPDLPPEVYHKQYESLFRKNGLYNIFLVTPQTPDERIKLIDGWSSGFIYLVSSSSTTGAKSQIQSQQEAYFNKIQSLSLRNPGIIGFGISNHETYTKACQYAKGAIIGSAFVKLLDESENLEKDIPDFIKAIKGELSKS